jgi:hypothetical protein
MFIYVAICACQIAVLSNKYSEFNIDHTFQEEISSHAFSFQIEYHLTMFSNTTGDILFVPSIERGTLG